MRCRCVLLAVLGLGLAAPPAVAQVIVTPAPTPYGYGTTYGFSYTRTYRQGSLSLGVSGLSPSGGYLVPVGNLRPYPGTLSGGTTVVITQPTVVLRPRIIVDDLALEVLPREVLEANGVKLPPRDVPPEPRDAGTQKPPEPVRPPQPPPKPVVPPPPPDLPLKLPQLPQPPDPVEDDRAEHARLVRLGREAFTAQENGRAADRFRQAIRLRPIEPTAHFLLAQALFALGKYPEAADAVRAGLALRADWPASAYRFREAYGADLGSFAEHLHRLEEAHDRFPDDANVLFLLGYVLWFDEKRAEARPLLRKALTLGGDRVTIGRFLEPAGFP
jgi:hypothetical protein